MEPALYQIRTKSPQRQTRAEKPRGARLWDSRRVGEDNYRLIRYISRHNLDSGSARYKVEANQPFVRERENAGQHATSLKNFSDLGIAIWQLKR